jgi:hypothetical protein
MSLLAIGLLLGASIISLAAASSPSSGTPTAGAVIDRLQLVGLPMGGATLLSEEEIHLLPFSPTEALQFEIPLEGGFQGRVFLFTGVGSMETAMAHLQASPQIGGPPTWLFPYGRVLLQMDGRVPEEWATRYQDAMYSLAWAVE